VRVISASVRASRFHVGLHRLDEAQVDEPLDRAERLGRAGRELLRERLVKTREFREGDVDR
jgi:hypothetical protein